MEYNLRLLDQDFWETSTDLALYDLSIPGAAAMNRMCKASPNVYYFSWGSLASKRSRLSGEQIPIAGLTPPFIITSLYMGRHKDVLQGKYKIDRRWLPNDGLVNTFSHKGPVLDSTDKIRPFTSPPEKGVWNFMGNLHNCSHWGMQNFSVVKDYKPKGYRFYADWLLEHIKYIMPLE